MVQVTSMVKKTLPEQPTFPKALKYILPKIHIMKRRFLESYSPEMLLYQVILNFFKAISWHLHHLPSTWTSSSYKDIIASNIAKFETLITSKNLLLLLPTVDSTLQPTQLQTSDFDEITPHRIHTLQSLVRKRLHGRSRTCMRRAMSARVKKLDELREANKIGALISQLSHSPRQPLDLSYLKPADSATPIANPKQIHKHICDHFSNWYSHPEEAGVTAGKLVDLSSAYVSDLLNGTRNDEFWTGSPLPGDNQEKFITACKRKATPELTQELEQSMDAPITFEEFTSTIDHLQKNKAPGPSMATSNMYKALTPDLRRVIFQLLTQCWSTKHTPRWWRDRLLSLAPKTLDSSSLDNIRPISLYEISRKIWTTIIVKRISRLWEKHKILNLNQHGFRRRQGTETAILRVLQRLETSWDTAPEFLLSWDIKRAFDSIPKGLLLLAWQRLGVPPDTALWLSQLDIDGDVYPWTPHYIESTRFHSFSYLSSRDSSFVTNHSPSFRAVRGIGQGDTLSTVAWIAVYDILLDMIHPPISIPRLLTARETTYQSSNVAYADDLHTGSSNIQTLQNTADNVCTFCSLSGLQISVKKLQLTLLCSNQHLTYLPVNSHPSIYGKSLLHASSLYGKSRSVVVFYIVQLKLCGHCLVMWNWIQY